MTPEERARRAADAMWARDAASQAMGMALEAVGEGTARLSLTVAPRHCNGHGTCHGGVIFSLADSAFAVACNARNEVTVAQHAQVSFLAPARTGDRLVAEARELHLAGRSGIYDVRVTGPDGPVAEFRGMSRRLRGQIFEEDA
jgi:acyl-CoA thioesterase